MKKFFGFGKSKSQSQEQAAASKSQKSKGSKQAGSSQLGNIKAEMDEYRGQRYNPAEDDGITTESLFKVIDGDTGEAIDVRELLGVTEEEFKANPELQAALAHMNNIQPISEAAQQQDPQSQPQIIEEEKKDDEDRPMDQKARHFKYFEMLDTLPSAQQV